MSFGAMLCIVISNKRKKRRTKIDSPLFVLRLRRWGEKCFALTIYPYFAAA
jgi:hypothetical protein